MITIPLSSSELIYVLVETLEMCSKMVIFIYLVYSFFDWLNARSKMKHRQRILKDAGDLSIPHYIEFLKCFKPKTDAQNKDHN